MRGRRRTKARQQPERRQSWRLTRRELTHLMSRHGRKWVREVWGATTRTAGELESLSPLTTPLGNRLVERFAAGERLEGDEIQRALRIALVTGYACRGVIVGPTEQPSLRRSAFDLGPRADPEQLGADPHEVGKLLDPVRRIANDRFESVMNLPTEVWTGYVATATNKLQRQLTSKTLTWRQFGRARIETMLRYGYVLRCLDEALEAEPALRTAQGS